jgi:hypothetical protein
MHVKYQVFISSTFKDLEEERRTVIEQVLNLGHIPVGMELFQAGDETQWDYIKKRILACDYYVVIVGERYGSEGPEGKSYTQMEYEFAIANEVPVAAFPLHEEARRAWPQEKVEWDKRDKVAEFRALCESRMAKHWRNADELGSRVLTALVEMMATYPRVGWVRADAVAPEAALQEIAKLSEEKRNLQSELANFKMMQASLRTPIDVKYRMKVLSNKTAADFIGPRGDAPSREGISFSSNELSILDLFLLNYDIFANHASIYVIRQCFYEALGVHGASILDIDISDILAQLSANALIEPDTTGSTPRYKLTDYGKQFLMYADLERSESQESNVSNVN